MKLNQKTVTILANLTLLVLPDVARAEPAVLKTASTHSMRYYLSLPSGNIALQHWQMLICIDGASSEFAEAVQEFSRHRGDLPILIVVPCTFSNTNELQGAMLAKYRKLYTHETIEQARGQHDPRGIEWDKTGVLAILQDLQREYGVRPRFFVTGFSGGGLLTYELLLLHPELLAGAALVCANFISPERYVPDKAKATGPLNAPVIQIMGGQDPLRNKLSIATGPISLELAACIGVAFGIGAGYIVWKRSRKTLMPLLLAAFCIVASIVLFRSGTMTIGGIDEQADLAARLLQQHGYGNVKRIVVAEMGHSRAVQQVFLELELPRKTPGQ